MVHEETEGDGARPESATTPGTPREMERPRPAERVAAFLEVVLVSGIPTQIVVMVLLLAAGIPQTGEDGSLSRTFVYSLLLADTAIVLTLVAVFLRAGRDDWRRVLLGLAPRRRDWLTGLASVPLVIIAVSGVLAALRAWMPGLHNVATNPFESLVRTGQDALLMGALAVLSGGVKEEIQRAFVLHRFGRFLGGERVGLAVFSLAFGAGHVMQGWDVAIVTALLGAFWGMLYLWRRSIAGPVASHSGFNVAQIVQFLVAGS